MVTQAKAWDYNFWVTLEVILHGEYIVINLLFVIISTKKKKIFKEKYLILKLKKIIKQRI